MAGAPTCSMGECRNPTRHPSGRCHHHRGVRAAPAAATGEVPMAPDPFDADDMDRSEPTLDRVRTWSPAGRVPRRDRNVRYRPTLPALISRHAPAIPGDVRSLAEDAAMELRSADDAGATSTSTIPLLRSESAASSKIEHIEVKQRYVARALAGLPTRQRAANEVANNIRAVQQALEDANVPLDVAGLNAIHATLLPDEVGAGELRDKQNWVGGSDHSPRGARYVPPVPERVPECVHDLLAFMERRDLPAVVQAGLVHAQFEAVHPYEDGNGRVGRALIHRVLRARGVVRHGVAPVSVAMLVQRDRYLEDLKAYDEGDAGQFARHFSESALLAADASHRLTSDIAQIVAEWQEDPVIANARSDATVRRLVPDLAAHPAMDTNSIMDRYEVSRPAALGALESLTEAGILNRTTATRGLYVYEAPEIFDAIDNIEREMLDQVDV